MKSSHSESGADPDCTNPTARDSVSKVLNDCYGSDQPENFAYSDDFMGLNSPESEKSYQRKPETLRIVDGRLQTVGFCIVSPYEIHFQQKIQAKSILKQRKIADHLQIRERSSPLWKEFLDCFC